MIVEKIFLSLSIVLLHTAFASSQSNQFSINHLIISHANDTSGNEIVGIIVPGKPPENYREPIAYPTRSSVTLPLVPAYDWSFGCSATSAAMAAGYYDNNGYINMYAGPANSGVAPLNNSSWGTVVINGETRSLCPISASMDGLDGRTTLGHVDDYWVMYNSSSDDPYITGGWTQHTYGDCTGDFMGTNQSDLANVDGSTTFYFYTNGAPLYNYTGAEPSRVDGCHGLRDFYESRGYDVLQNYSQYIYGYNGNTQGFSFNQYKAEIDSGRVVLIQVTGHTMLGYGYDDATSTLYVHDTWDYSSHTMTWGGDYAGLTHYGITVVKLEQAIFGPNANFIADNLAPTLNNTVNFSDQSNGSPAITSWTWSISPSTFSFVDGTNASSQNPKIQFTSEDFYTIALTVSNGNNSDTETKTDYIYAIDCSEQPFPFTEDFSSGSLPACWSMTDHLGNGQVWSFNNPGNRTINTATSGNGFAILDSDHYGSSGSQDCDLVTPMLDLSAAFAVVLTFQHYFLQYTGSSATLSCSTNGGATWTVLQTWTTTTSNPATYSQDLSEELAGRDSVLFKWNYTGNYGWFWAVDDIEINSDVPGLWTGATSSDWSIASNWANGTIPDSLTDITISPTAQNWPVITGNLVIGTTSGNINLDGDVEMTINGDLVISEGNSLTFNGPGLLNITGDWINSGTFNPGQGTVNFAGNTSSQVIFNNYYSSDASDYTRNTFAVGMTQLSSGTVGPKNADNGFAQVPIGFDFSFAGDIYDSVWITTNGCIHFSETGAGNPNNENLFSTNIPNWMIAPWWDDLTEDASSLLRYATEGTVPSRVFTTEWWQVPSYRTGATSRLKFQVKLFEGTNIIEFHYGTVGGGTHNASESASIGIEDATGGSGHFIDATTGSSTIGISTLVSPGNWPTVNYRFEPAIVSEIFNNLVISKNNATLTVVNDMDISGSLTVNPGAGLKILSGKTLKLNNP